MNLGILYPGAFLIWATYSLEPRGGLHRQMGAWGGQGESPEGQWRGRAWKPRKTGQKGGEEASGGNPGRWLIWEKLLCGLPVASKASVDNDLLPFKPCWWSLTHSSVASWLCDLDHVTQFPVPRFLICRMKTPHTGLWWGLNEFIPFSAWHSAL